MKSMLRIASLGALLLMAACNQDASTSAADAGAKNLKPEPGKDWVKTIAATPEGGYRIGNPNAPVKLLEFGSFTCPHCRDFHKSAMKTLKEKYIASGKVSYEFRSFILNGIDVPVSLLAYCTPTQAFFPTQDGLYQTQENWLGGIEKAGAAALQKLDKMPQDKQFASVIQITGLDQFFKLRGLPAAKQEQCLADKATLDKLAAIRNDAVKTYNLTGTPTFAINGKTQENIFDWKGLEPNLIAALE